jgi:hypothetical protein
VIPSARSDGSDASLAAGSTGGIAEGGLAVEETELLDASSVGANPRSRWGLVGVGAAALAGCAYVALYDPNGSSALYPVCPFNAVTGLDCPGCGITRALHALLTGDVVRALDHNVLFVLALPLVLWAVAASAARRSGRRFPGPELRWQPWTTVTVAVLVGGFWLVRNLPGLPWLAAGAA